LARPAAIKMIRSDALGTNGSSQSASLVSRFQREAQITASLRSPHTVELYDFGSTTDGTFYYVMEYLQGFDLDTLVDRFGPLPQSGPRISLNRQQSRSLKLTRGA
ncbi:MAG TPA: serine/threonine protein kinase, partial [Acidobacteriota bacterium]|nr:serine/threonine protein kinase [Acidobacteriota bacterium]